ncbi:MAG: ABC transporter ATP-binding protein, partial [Candidatus Yonathbacteria bacterium]|nr:ABC transporter ATP-binding protein [Candidatus Yonathbacteria bacterium]
VGIATKEEFWALRNVNLEINKGDIVGIIGHNGAGKSTLLKILTGITPPTEGEIIMHGKVASLLEVGTGFHPELTGRENIFLNGAILGMTKKEIVKKFDEIVAFSGVEKFLDTPVKYYSSGMYVRLAFSVAAHMEPDILLVDEVLAVGDAEFQKKCLGKMEEVTKQEGRTILLISHNMTAIEQLCRKTILFENGKVRMIGKTEDVIAEYLNTKETLSKQPITERKNNNGSKRVVFTHCEMSEYDKEKRRLTFEIHYKNNSKEAFENIKISLDIKDQQGTHLTNITNTVLDQKIDLDSDKGIIHLSIDGINLFTGNYYADLFLATDAVNSEILNWVSDACMFTIDNSSFYESRRLPPIPSKLLFDFKYN